MALVSAPGPVDLRNLDQVVHQRDMEADGVSRQSRPVASRRDLPLPQKPRHLGTTCGNAPGQIMIDHGRAPPDWRRPPDR